MRDSLDRAMYCEWHNAALQRAKKMPKLDEMLSKKKVKKLDPTAIMAQLKAYNAQRAKHGN